ncbi:RNA polymerase sigma-70 factor [Pedobacter sp. MC2016-15]|uniref:RNA polymerase sigma factor n=1 Tax=Pedobacter sp. MC2016-15 TaxID=2994473 RepID=UPI00224745D7|nr:RNA polymerase sigma-70 factor [Pedobacter sp. MC2016-15]MCX2479711.1 RNA polymerase sigma-70 factor [Pedobacter sp. MC2016-15]
MTEYTTLTDRKLVKLIRAGNAQAYTEVYLRYRRPLYLQAYKMLRDHEDARDIVQDLYLKIWETRYTLLVKTNLESYLHQAVRHRVIDFIRRQVTVTRYLDSLITFLDQELITPDEYYIEKETLDLFKQELNALPEKMREVFELSRTEGLSHKEIAKKLGISERTVKKQIYMALKKLRVGMHYALIPYLFF